MADGAGHTALTAWLLRLGVRVLHGRPYHPQTQGKEERFHRTLKQELLTRHTWRDLAHCAAEFSRYRHRYNYERPHDALGGNPPATRYQPSVRSMPATLPIPEYPNMEVRVVRAKGVITFGNQTWHIGNAFDSLPIGLRPSAQADGQWEVYFAHFKLGTLDLTTPPSAKHTLSSLSALTSPKDQSCSVSAFSSVTHVSEHVLPLSPAQTIRTYVGSLASASRASHKRGLAPRYEFPSPGAVRSHRIQTKKSASVVS